MRFVTSVFLIGCSCSIAVGTANTTDADAEQMLRQALQSKNPDTRKTGVVALSLASGHDPLFVDLEAMMGDKDVPVRLAVISSLSEVKTPEATKALRMALSDPTPEVSFAAAKALFGRNDPEGKKALLAVLQHESKTNSSFISSQLREALRMMHTPTTTFLYLARFGIGYAPVPGLGFGVSSLQAILSEGELSGAASAALLLGKDHDPETVAALKEALTDKNWRVRAAAVHSLAVMNQVSTRPSMELLTQDDKEEVRLRAAAALLRFDAIEKSHKVRKPAEKAPLGQQ